MNTWCVSRNMSWDAVGNICKKHGISFEQLPVSGPGFWEELQKELDKKAHQNKSK